MGMKFRVLHRSQWIMSPTAPLPRAPRRGPGTAEYLDTIGETSDAPLTRLRRGSLFAMCAADQ